MSDWSSLGDGWEHRSSSLILVPHGVEIPPALASVRRLLAAQTDLAGFLPLLLGELQVARDHPARRAARRTRP
eukprot:CAMPEP_0205888850 /NCGR_PEP_ID=MMETSP1083-20121108/20628_1 /ASSEMBLY_ACC=CAM_ASM_000430 /TAXON_ID=97485 /ORGANISM="Prymnesium parvum, Strain Texoma1" /LENGTH=72 /DNA_ID=CAMNT_0053252859 /DNA_START=257 /DNA_END=472 /DNA_ORIENTATION=+